MKLCINDQRYQRLLLEPFINQLVDVELTSGYLQQDSVAAHMTRGVLPKRMDHYRIAVKPFT
jgi:hypothetical protein